MSEHAGSSKANDEESVEGTPLERLEAARERLERIEADVDDHGGTAVEDAADAYRKATKLLDDYVGRATGTGRETFKSYVQLEGQFTALVGSLSDDLRDRAAFENALDAIDKRRLSESDFEAAHRALEPATQYAELIDERDAARDELSEARKAASMRIRTIDDEIDERERLLELANADLEAPVERLREPIEAYDAAIREAFADYRLEAATREVFELLERSRWYPFVGYERPPDDLREYVDESPDGEHSIPELLEYAEHSRSKLTHLVADADALKRRVATQRTYLDGIDADPLTIGWPPESAGVLRRKTREYRPFVERVGDEETVTALREVRELTFDPDYDRLQTAAQAVDQLSPAERERLADGQIAEELESLRTERERLETALEVDDPV
ncbi:DUF7118 family protein [Natrarchaeobaculum sulfurireducens]|uniref:Uncharacterized protein n=1 Tax=Natrarchaeobaculum sulfurireducens TaxID=2044521 RepID=A0A346PLJ4_9EURY|nr:hypothetical protein [Natrarchaeobaculum sulfurireducens]AXR76718.1 hypothetical protein AArc1_0374 [Natrarchaeobaculum sulfurireducens]AXR80389.1 hypothetical protein AArcMg_0366 [Natrarchaeobaculum sulfurireducens]